MKFAAETVSGRPGVSLGDVAKPVRVKFEVPPTIFDEWQLITDQGVENFVDLLMPTK